MRMRLVIPTIVAIAVSVSACASSSSAPPITVESAAAISADAVIRACAGTCTSHTIYVHDRLFGHDSTAGDEEPMPELSRRAIAETLGQAHFVDQQAADALFGDDALVDGGRGVLISVGPILRIGAHVVGIDVGILTARDGGGGRTHQYVWLDDTWSPTTSESTGITDVIWMY